MSIESKGEKNSTAHVHGSLDILFSLNRYSYRLFVDGKEIESFRERQSKILKTWIYVDHPEAQPTRVTLERDTMDVYVNGEKVRASSKRYMCLL